jgi:2-polyprenyl-6-hydroxyphenyl methylase/3-demethylubiquinone-9 3-methyltransferase
MRNDLGIYDRHAGGWWAGDDRTFRSLRAVSEFRLAWLLRHVPLPVPGARIADLGCGGGLLAVPLAARGARLLGLDLSVPSLREARARAGPGSLFLRADVRRTPLADASTDLVLLADVLEHVPDWPRAVAEAARILRRGGALYVNTINRTRRARLLAVALAERLGFLPRGTHDPALFVRPDELRATAARYGLRCCTITGEVPRLFTTVRTGAIRLRTSRSLAVAYGALFVKEQA